jgi:hypothetical protein
MATGGGQDILTKLLERRAELVKEAAALDALISHYQRLESRMESESLEMPGQLSFYGAPSSRAVKAAEIARMVDAARRIILVANRPMKRGDIAQALEQQGFELPGRDKNKVLGTNLWRSGKFRTIGDQGYWPKDTPLPRD